MRDATSNDAYYYLQIARNIDAGPGASFNSETLSNGFHPLWLLHVTPLHRLSDDPESRGGCPSHGAGGIPAK